MQCHAQSLSANRRKSGRCRYVKGTYTQEEKEKVSANQLTSCDFLTQHKGVIMLNRFTINLFAEPHGLTAFALILFSSAFHPGFAADNSSVDGLCESANVLCQESCDLAKYTSAQRSACGRQCQASFEDCTGRFRKHSTVGESQGDAGAEMKAEPIKKKKIRKPGIKQ
jgi:hypothetical protein